MNRAAGGDRPSVDRARFVAELERFPQPKVIVVRACAGAGKTFALRRWAARRPATAYLELAPSHDTPEGLLEALASALGTAEVPRSATHTLGDVVAAATDDIDTIVFDSAERLTHPAVLHALDELVSGPPESVRFVFCGRSTPPLASLAVARLQGELREIRDDVLRLDEREALELFETAAGRPPPDDDVVPRLMALSEGWFGGFRLAAATWRADDGDGAGRTARTDAKRLDDAMAPIASYVFGDVLSRLSPRLVNFLVDTSAFEELEAEMCDAARERSDSAHLLGELERLTAFVRPVAGSPGRYRLHGLVRRAVLDVARAENPTRVHELHAKAADLCWLAGDETAAMRNLVAADRVNDAWQLFLDHWTDRFFSGAFITLSEWVALLDATDVRDSDRCAELVCAMVLLGRVQRAEQLLVELNRLHGRQPRSIPLEVARFLHSYARGSLDVALLHATRARADDGPGSLWRRLRADLGLCFQLAFVDRIDEAWSAYDSARRDEDTTALLDAVTYPSALAHLALTEGRLGEAEALTTRALAAGTRLDPIARSMLCEAHQTAGFVHTERNELDDAERHFREAIVAADAVAVAHTRVLPRLGMARIAHIRGDRDRAYETLDRCRNLPNTRLDWHFLERIAEVEAGLRLREGDAQGALDGLPAMPSHRLGLIEVRALAALGEHERAIDMLARIRAPGSRRGVQSLLVLARCLPDHNARTNALREALQLAERQSYVRVLIDEKTWLIDRLLGLVPTWPTGFVQTVLELSIDESTHADLTRVPLTPYSPLSPREIEVWRYLATSLSMSEIADQLFVSRNTIKTHVRNLYRKLGVTTREEAVNVEVVDYRPAGSDRPTRAGGRVATRPPADPGEKPAGRESQLTC
jgi:LuxR family maltose regulon positive regulatory protein